MASACSWPVAGDSHLSVGTQPGYSGPGKMAREAGAFCVALVNDETAPIKDIVDLVLPLRAGEEQAVAATKSYLATLSALLQLAAAWTQSLSWPAP